MPKCARDLAGAMLAALFVAVVPAEASPKPLRVLLLSGMNNHDWARTTPALKRILEDSGRFHVEVCDNPSALDAPRLAQCDVVVSNWTNFPRDERAWGPQADRALLDFVRSGKGFVVFHAAAACFWSWPEYQQLVGATWALGTTGHGAIHTFAVARADRRHPITRGLADFTLPDELWHRIAVQPTAHVICTAFSTADRGGTGKTEPVALVTRLGRGRGFNLVLGHDVAAMESPGWRLLMLRGAEWAATGRATLTVPVDPDAALAVIAGYRRPQNRASLAAVEMLVQRAGTDRGLRRRLAERMVRLLRSDATDDCKAFLLQQLSCVGGARDARAAAALIAHERLGFYALTALERLPGTRVSAALRSAAEAAKGPVLVGVINALGERCDPAAVECLARRLGDPDDAVVGAAVEALGKTGGAPATEALQRFAVGARGARRRMAAGALLKCAESLRSAGDLEAAAAVYRRLQARGLPQYVRLAAFTGLVSCAPHDRADLLLAALAGEDTSLAIAAAHCLRAPGDRRVARAITAKLPTLRPAVQALVIGAWAERGESDVAPAMAAAVGSSDGEVRLAAVRALGRVGGACAASALMSALKAGPSDAERAAIEAALAGTWRRAGIALASLSELSAEEPAARASLLRALGLTGDERSLAVLRAAVAEGPADTRLAALRALGEWPDGTPLPDLLAVARSAAEAGQRAAALRSLAVLALRDRAAAADTVRALGEALALPAGADEKRALLASLGELRHPAALQVAAAALGDASISEDACLAAVRIAGALPESSRAEVQVVLERVLAVGRSERVRTPAKSILLRLGIPVEVTRSVALPDPGPNLALGATAASPDGVESDGAASGDQAAIDGDPSTYWDEADNQPLYRLQVTLKSPQVVSALRITGYQQHAYAPRDFEVACDGRVVLTVKDAWYESNQFAATFPPTRCTVLELTITGYYGLSPAIRELEILDPATPGR